MKSLGGMLLGIILMVFLVVGAAYGYVHNIVELTRCDFEAPFKAEIVRVIGIPFTPVGIIAGYCDLGK
jgi:hypothetical protein